MSLVQNVNQLNQLVRGEDSNTFGNCYVNNRINGNTNPELLRVIRNNETEIPFIFRNIGQENNDEKIITWDLNGEYIRLEILRWMENRQAYINLFTQNINRWRVGNPNTNLWVWILSKDILDSFLKRKLVTYPALMCNTLDAHFFAGEMDSYAFSRCDFKPRGWPTDRKKSFLVDEIDIAMMKLREFNLEMLTEGQKKALFLEYKRIKYSVCKKKIVNKRIIIGNIEAYINFLNLVSFLCEAEEDELAEAYEMFMNYFEFTEKMTTNREETEMEPEETETIIWEKEESEEEIDINNIPFFTRENEEKNDTNNIPSFTRRENEEPIRIFSNIEPDDNFSISFLNKKTERVNDVEEN